MNYISNADEIINKKKLGGMKNFNHINIHEININNLMLISISILEISNSTLSCEIYKYRNFHSQMLENISDSVFE